MKRRSVTLIEVVISMGLLTLLLSTLFFWHGYLSRNKHDLWPTLEKRYLHQRLMQVLPKVESPFFTASDGSLVFQFDRGIAEEPLLSNRVLGRLYHDDEKRQLCLGIWPEPPLTTPSQTLTLLENVDNVLLEFYFPPVVHNMPVAPEEVGRSHPQEEWQESWSPEYATLPSLIRLTINDDIDNEYYFDLPSPIYYGIDA